MFVHCVYLCICHVYVIQHRAIHYIPQNLLEARAQEVTFVMFSSFKFILNYIQ